jgi:hypothetical protein
MLLLPVFAGQSQFSYIVRLDNAEYRLRFTWLERAASWYLDVELPDGTRLATGRRICTGWNPLHRDQDPRLWSGYLLPIHVDGDLDDMTQQSDLGSVVDLFYLDADEVVSSNTTGTLTIVVAP